MRPGKRTPLWQIRVGIARPNWSSRVLIVLALPDDLLQEAVPGNIRRAEHFVAFLKRFVEYLKVISAVASFNAMCPNLCPGQQTRMRVLHVISETPPSFLQHLKDLTFIEKKPLR